MAYVMSKLTRIICQLSDEEYQQLYHSLVDGEALKSADLLKILREEELEEEDILERLDVSANAYYALRSRLNKKIESFYLDQLEGGKNDLYKQVANINELVLTKNRIIAIATLKKLEKELANNDLFHELTLVYQALKKLHINTPEHFQYSQLYNKHNAQLLAFEKVETLTAEYFKNYNKGLLEMRVKEDKESQLIRESIDSINNRYNSHRIYTLKALSFIFHEINQVEKKTRHKIIQNQFTELDRIFKLYNSDLLYNHLKWVLSYLKLLYAYKKNNLNDIESHLKELDPISGRLLTNYTAFSTTVYFLLIKLEFAINNGKVKTLEKHNEVFFRNFDIDSVYPLSNTIFFYYRAFSCFYGKNIDDAIEWIEKAISISNVKEHEKFLVDLKLISAGFLYIKGDYEASLVHINYIQRILRISEKSNFEYAYLFRKTLKAALSDIEFDKKKRKYDHAKAMFIESQKPFQSPLRFFDVNQIICKEITQKQIQPLSCK